MKREEAIRRLICAAKTVADSTYIDEEERTLLKGALDAYERSVVVEWRWDDIREWIAFLPDGRSISVCEDSIPKSDNEKFEWAVFAQDGESITHIGYCASYDEGKVAAEKAAGVDR